MTKKYAKNYNLAEMMPSELNELKTLVTEFITRLQNIENEIYIPIFGLNRPEDFFRTGIPFPAIPADALRSGK